jgi:hypothetical protein
MISCEYEEICPRPEETDPESAPERWYHLQMI